MSAIAPVAFKLLNATLGLVVIVIRMIDLLALIRVRMSPVPVFGLLSAACVLKVAIVFVVFG